MDDKEMEGPADYVVLPNTKKPGYDVPTRVPLKYDFERQRIILPKEEFAKNPDFFMHVEQSFIKEILVAAFGTLLRVDAPNIC